MSLPIHLFNKFIVGGDSNVSGNMASNITSLAMNIDDAVNYSIQAVMTGSPVGTIQIQASNDILVSSGMVPQNWTTIPTSTSSISAAGTYLINVEFPAYSWVQLLYTASSGSGTMVANINAKRL